MTDYFQRQFEYNRRMNQVFIADFSAQMPPAEAIRLFSHVFNAHFIWLHRMGLGGEPPDIWDLHLPGTMKVFNQEAHELTFAYLKRENWANQIIDYQTSEGKRFTSPAKDILFHLINHSTYHRAQIAFLLRRHEIKPPQTDFIKWAREEA